MLLAGILFLCLLVHAVLSISTGIDLLPACLLALGLLLVPVVAYVVRRQWVVPLEKLVVLVRKIADQEKDIDFEIPHYPLPAAQLQSVAQQMQDAVTFIRAISHGDLHTDIPAHVKDTELGKAMAEMKVKLSEKEAEENRRNWHTSGIAALSEELRKYQHLTMAEVSLHFVQKMVHYCNLNQGGVFLINDREEPKYIELMGCVAYHKQKFIEKRLEWGQGLVGQCILEGESIYLEEVPAHYVAITSGLGESTPRSILLVPVLHKEQALGVLEVASFRKLTRHEVAFVEACCEIFGSVIYNTKINEHTQKLLTHSRRIAEELSQKEEVLRQNTEELMTAQEELNRQLRNSERQTKLTHSIIEAINKTNASIELDKNGMILDANEMYLSLMEYTREEIVGKPEKQFVAAEELESHRYEMMWDSIQNGSFNSGEFRRINKRGKELWLSGTYSPIFDVEGQLLKIIQLGQFTTEQREKELEYMHKVNAMNQAVYYLELSCEGRIISSNALFQKEFGYKRSEISNRNFTDFLHESHKQDVRFGNLCDMCEENTQNSISLRFMTKDGREKYFVASFSPLKNLAGETNKLMLIMIDFTRQHELQDQIRDLLVNTKREKAVLELNAVMVGAFADHFSQMIMDLEKKYDHEDILYTLKGKNHKIPQLLLTPEGTVTACNERAADVVGVCLAHMDQMSVYDMFHFACDEERDALKAQLATPQLREIKLKVMTATGSFIKLTAFTAPNSTDRSQFSLVSLLIIHVALPRS